MGGYRPNPICRSGRCWSHASCTTHDIWVWPIFISCYLLFSASPVALPKFLLWVSFLFSDCQLVIKFEIFSFSFFLSITFPFLSHLLLKYFYAVLKKFRFTIFFVHSRIQRGNSNGARFPLNLWGIHLLGYRYRELWSQLSKMRMGLIGLHILVPRYPVMHLYIHMNWDMLYVICLILWVV
jgi:hypothetical protein